MLNSSGYFENPYFSEDELRCKGNGELNLAPGFLGMLVNFRDDWGLPLTPTSCCRSLEHNIAVGGHVSSLHLTSNKERSIVGTMAIDISIAGWSDDTVRDFIEFAQLRGFSTGEAKTFIHLDARILLGRSRADFTY